MSSRAVPDISLLTLQGKEREETPVQPLSDMGIFGVDGLKTGCRMEFAESQAYFRTLGFELFYDPTYIAPEVLCLEPICLRDNTGLYEWDDPVLSYASLTDFWECWTRVFERFRADEWFVLRVIDDYFNGTIASRELIKNWSMGGCLPCGDLGRVYCALEQQSKTIPFYENDDWPEVLAELLPIYWRDMGPLSCMVEERILLEERKRLSSNLPLPKAASTRSSRL